jgi:hypothetical protein
MAKPKTSRMALALAPTPVPPRVRGLAEKSPR